MADRRGVLLTGRRAHAHGDRTLAEIERDISQHPPSAPSTNIDPEHLAIAPRELRELRRRLAGDLDRVLLKALEPEPAQRYGSARDFADDLKRWLDGRPVEARAGGAAHADALLQPAILDWRGGRYADAEGRMRDAIARLERETAPAAALAQARALTGTTEAPAANTSDC